MISQKYYSTFYINKPFLIPGYLQHRQYLTDSPKIHCIIFNMMKEAITWQKQRHYLCHQQQARDL